MSKKSERRLLVEYKQVKTCKHDKQSLDVFEMSGWNKMINVRRKVRSHVYYA